MVVSSNLKSPIQTVTLHLGQWEILNSASRTTIATAGQGGGKTLSGYYWLLANMRAFPGESHLIGFPDYGLLQRIIINQPDPDRQTIVQFLAAMGERPKLKIREGMIQCTSGQIFFASGEHLVGWEGSHVKTAWLDEFDEMPLGAYHRAMERTRMRQGFVLLTGTLRKVLWVREELEPKWKHGVYNTKTTQVHGYDMQVQTWTTPDVKRIQYPSPLNPAYSMGALEEAKRLLPDWEFRRLYLGELSEMEGGGVFRREWWQYANLSAYPIMAEIVQVWDTAFREKTSADFSVCGTWGFHSNKVYLMDIWRRQVEWPDLVQAALALAAKYKPGRIMVEDAASGISLIQDFKRSTHLPIIAVKVDRDKYARASAVSGMVQSGRVILPKDAPWLHDYVEELTAFQSPSWHDDQVDVTSMALAYFANRATGKIPLHV